MKQWKSLIWITAGLAAVGVLSVFTAKPLLAQARAALVQVVNTAAAPAVSQDVSKLASQNISFLSSPVAFPGSDSLHILGKDGQFNAAPYTVPAGQTLIITSVDFFPNSAFSFSPAVALKNSANAASLYGVWLAASGVSTQFLYPTGIAIQGGTTPAFNISQPTFSGVLNVLVHGYLTSN